MKGYRVSAPYLTDEERAAFIAGPAPDYREPTEYEQHILAGLQLKPHVYQGPVDANALGGGRRLTVEKIARRRRRNRAARATRAAQRKAAAK